MRKRVISMIFSLIMLVTFLPMQGYALEDSEIRQYAREVAGQYLGLQNVNPEGEFYLSQGFEVTNAEDSSLRIFFVFEGTTCIGKLSVAQVEGKYASSYVHYQYETITELLRMDEDFYLCVEDEELYCCDDTTMISVNDNVKIEKVIMSRLILLEENLSLQKIDILIANQNTNSGIALVADYGSTLSSNYGMLNVPIVENEKLDGDYHCWAACVASQVSYKNKIDPLDAYDVHLAMKQTYPRATYGKPEGTQLWIERAYSYYNANVGSFNSGACYDEVKNLIQQNCPVFAALADSTMTYGHAVIICGYQSAQGGYYYYTIMDPNEPSYVTVQTTSSSTSRSFTIVSNNMTFTEWMYGYY